MLGHRRSVIGLLMTLLLMGGLLTIPVAASNAAAIALYAIATRA